MPDPKPGAISEVAKCLRELRRARAGLVKAKEVLGEAEEEVWRAKCAVKARERMLIQATREEGQNEAPKT